MNIDDTKLHCIMSFIQQFDITIEYFQQHNNKKTSNGNNKFPTIGTKLFLNKSFKNIMCNIDHK